MKIEARVADHNVITKDVSMRYDTFHWKAITATSDTKTILKVCEGGLKSWAEDNGYFILSIKSRIEGQLVTASCDAVSWTALQDVKVVT